MSNGSMPTTCKWLREARRAKGYQNVGQAGLATHRSPEAVGRHERGDVPLQMADVIEYAQAYDSPTLLMAFCSECAIRQELFGAREQHFDSLPVTVIRMANRLRRAAAHADQLALIMDDGRVDTGEIPQLQVTLDFLQEMECVWRDLVTACMRSGIRAKKIDRPAGPGTVCTSANAHHSK